MLISEFATSSGLSRDTIRFYVKKGLLRPALGSSENNRYQTFGADDVERANMIRHAQSIGFTLREIAALESEFNASGMTTERQVEVMRARAAVVEAQLASLHALRAYLADKIYWLEAGAVGPEPRLTFASPESPAFKEPAPPVPAAVATTGKRR